MVYQFYCMALFHSPTRRHMIIWYKLSEVNELSTMRANLNLIKWQAKKILSKSVGNTLSLDLQIKIIIQKS